MDLESKGLGFNPQWWRSENTEICSSNKLSEVVGISVFSMVEKQKRVGIRDELLLRTTTTTTTTTTATTITTTYYDYYYYYYDYYYYYYY